MLTKHPTIALGAVVIFASIGFLVFANPMAALGVLGLAVLGVFLVRPLLLKLVVIALVLVPTSGFLRGSATARAATQLAQQVESGSIQNQIAATLLFCIGIALVFWGRQHIKEVNLLPWIGMYIALAFLSTLWSQSMLLTLRRSTGALFITIFALGVGSFYFGRRSRGDVELIRSICWATSVPIFAVLAFSVVRGDFHAADPAWRLGREGIENQIGWVSAVGFLVAWTTSTREDIWSKSKKWILWFNLAVPAMGVLLTKSRETWLGVLAGLFLLGFLKSHSWQKRAAATLVLVAVIAGFSFTPALKQMWLRGSSEEDLQSASGRTQLWEAAWPLIRSNIFLGHGFGAFWTGKTVLTFSSHWSPTSLHNGYLDTTAEVGVIGLLLIGMGVGVSARNAWRLMQRPRYREIGLALLVLYVAFLVINGFGGVLEAFNFFPVTAILVYSFFVSYRLQNPTVFPSRGTTGNLFL